MRMICMTYRAPDKDQLTSFARTQSLEGCRNAIRSSKRILRREKARRFESRNLSLVFSTSSEAENQWRFWHNRKPLCSVCSSAYTMPNSGQKYAAVVYAQIVAKSKPNSGTLKHLTNLKVLCKNTKLLGFLEKSFQVFSLKEWTVEKVGRQLV